MRALSFVAGLAVLWPAMSSAHIHLTAPLARTDSLTGDQKEQHCGVLNQTRTTRVTTFAPGETITVTWLETINHTGWYRIAFQPDGSVFGIPPEGNGPAGNGMASYFPTVNQEGPDVGGSIVLKDRIPDGTLTTTVTLPNMECTNCTLQFIQVMTDAPPYTTDAASNDIYFQCADITLSSGAPLVDAGPDQVGPDAGGDNNPGPTETSGGCATGGGAGLAAGLALLGLAITRRRRR